jgi:hypothetical protein
MDRMRKLWVLIVALTLVALPVWAANKVKVNVDEDVTFNLSTDQELAGLAVALKFADKNDDVTITGYSFEGTRLENLSLKEVIIDNIEKTVVVYGIVLNEANIALGDGPIVNLTVAGTGKVNFTPTTVGKQEGVTLVTPMAKEVPVELEQSLGTTPNLPVDFSMSPNFPNPFNATTTIRYSLPDQANVRLEVFNILGQKVKTLVNEPQAAGYKQVVWDGKNDQGDNVSSGVYFYRINAGKYHSVLKMSLLK